MKPIIKCPNCQEDVTYYFERGMKEGRTQTLEKVKEKIEKWIFDNELQDSATCEELLSKLEDDEVKE